MMQFLNDPDAMQKMVDAGNGLVTTLQQIRDAVILQNRLTAMQMLHPDRDANSPDDILLRTLLGEYEAPVGEGST